MGLCRHCKHGGIAWRAQDLCSWQCVQVYIVLIPLGQCMSVLMHVCVEADTRDCVMASLYPMSGAWIEIIKLGRDRHPSLTGAPCVDLH